VEFSEKRRNLSKNIAVKETWTLKQKYKTVLMDMVYLAIQTYRATRYFIIFLLFCKVCERNCTVNDPESVLWTHSSIRSPNLQMFKEPRNRFQEIDSASLCSLAVRYVKKGCRTGPPGWESIPRLLKRFTNTSSSHEGTIEEKNNVYVVFIWNTHRLAEFLTDSSSRGDRFFIKLG
jgi:hypothetical protein